MNLTVSQVINRMVPEQVREILENVSDNKLYHLIRMGMQELKSRHPQDITISMAFTKKGDQLNVGFTAKGKPTADKREEKS